MLLCDTRIEKKSVENKTSDTARRQSCCIPTNLTHWGRVTHICVNRLTILGSDMACRLAGAKPLSLNQCWNIVNSNLRNKLQWNHRHLKMSSAKSCPFCLGLSVLKRTLAAQNHNVCKYDKTEDKREPVCHIGPTRGVPNGLMWGYAIQKVICLRHVN